MVRKGEPVNDYYRLEVSGIAWINRTVRILGQHKVSEYGESDDWADDVILLEDPSGEPPA